MTYFDNYKAKMNVLGNTIRDGHINSSIDFTNSVFEDFLDYENITIDNVDYDTRLAHDKLSTKSQLLFRPNTIISIGKIATIKSEVWLVTDFIKNDLYPIATINKTNYTLKWKNELNQTISCFAIVENFRNQTDGVDSGKFIIYGNNDLYITLPNNSNTQKIIRNYRFIVGKDAYVVSKVDTYGKPGLILLTLKEDQITEVDDLVNDIADNTEIISLNPIIPSPISDEHYIDIIGSNTVKTNLTEVFSAYVYNNEVLTGEDVVWSITNEDGTTNPLYINIESSTSNNCVLKGINNLSHIGKWSVLKATLSTDPTIFDEIRIQLKSII